MKDCLTFALLMLAGCFAGGSLVLSSFLVFGAVVLQYDKIKEEFKKSSR